MVAVRLHLVWWNKNEYVCPLQPVCIPVAFHVMLHFFIPASLSRFLFCLNVSLPHFVLMFRPHSLLNIFTPTHAHTINYWAATSEMLFLPGLWWVTLSCVGCQLCLFQLQRRGRIKSWHASNSAVNQMLNIWRASLVQPLSFFNPMWKDTHLHTHTRIHTDNIWSITSTILVQILAGRICYRCMKYNMNMNWGSS